MTEEEAKKALFDINYEYMKHTPKERLELYDGYIEERNKIKKALIQAVMERREKELGLKLK